jgi:hypothetical protein
MFDMFRNCDEGERERCSYISNLGAQFRHHVVMDDLFQEFGPGKFLGSTPDHWDKGFINLRFQLKGRVYLLKDIVLSSKEFFKVDKSAQRHALQQVYGRNTQSYTGPEGPAGLISQFANFDGGSKRGARRPQRSRR